MVLEESADFLGNLVGNVSRFIRDLKRDSALVKRESEAFIAKASQSASSVKGAFKAAPRVARVVSEGVAIAMAYRFHRARTQHLDPEEAEAAMQPFFERSGERMYTLCVELRGGILKLGQFLSCRVDLLPAPWISWLSKLQDQVPAVPTEAIVDRIEAELGRPMSEVFARFDETCLAAASLAQVHAASLHGGQEVVVKVQVPGVEEVIAADIHALRILATTIGDMLPTMDLDTVVKELSRSLSRELDYRAEAKALIAFEDAFRDDARIRIPRLVRAHSSTQVLMMERIEGERLMTYLESCERGGESGLTARDRLFETLLDVTCAQVLAHGLLHADPHPGNFLVDEDGRLAILDFGAVQRFTTEERHAYANVVGAVLARDSARMAACLVGMGFRTEDGGTSSLEEIAATMLEAFATDATIDALRIDPRIQIDRLLEITRTNPVVQIPGSFVQLGRVLTAVAGYVFRFEPRVNLFKIVTPYIVSTTTET